MAECGAHELSERFMWPDETDLNDAAEKAFLIARRSALKAQYLSARPTVRDQTETKNED